MLHLDRQIDEIHELHRKNGARLRGPFRHTNVTVIFLSLYRLVRTFALDPKCNHSVSPDGIQRELSQHNSASPLANRNHWRRNVIGPDGSPMRTWVRVAAMPQRCSISCARTISRLCTSSAT